MSARPIPAEVRRWDRASIERWLELAGSHLSDGVGEWLADQKATMEMRRLRRERDEQRRTG